MKSVPTYQQWAQFQTVFNDNISIENMKPQKDICSTCVVLYDMEKNQTLQEQSLMLTKIIVEKFYAVNIELSRLNMSTKSSVQVANPLERQLPIL